MFLKKNNDGLEQKLWQAFRKKRDQIPKVELDFRAKLSSAIPGRFRDAQKIQPIQPRFWQWRVAIGFALVLLCFSVWHFFQRRTDPFKPTKVVYWEDPSPETDGFTPTKVVQFTNQDRYYPENEAN